MLRPWSGGGWWHSGRSVAATLDGACLSGAGVWAQPCSVKLAGGERWTPPPTLLRWADLHGRRTYGSQKVVCALVAVEVWRRAW